MSSYENPTYKYSLLYPTGWTIDQSNTALVTFTGPGSSSIVVDYDLDSTKASVADYKSAKVTAFQATVSGYTTVSDTPDNRAGTVKVDATYTQAAVAKRAYLFADYPKPRGFFIVLSAATADFSGLQNRFNQVLGSWQVPAIVK